MYALYNQEFADDPHRMYARMREHYRSLVPVELAPGVPATLVIGYRTAVHILHDPAHFPADPRRWQTSLPPHHPLRPMMEYRPNALRSCAPEHERYRKANVDAIAAIDMHAIRHKVVEPIAVELIGELGNAADDPEQPVDLLSRYIYPLIGRVLGNMLGFERDTLEAVGAGMAALFEAMGNAEAGNEQLMTALFEHIERKRKSPGADITTQLLNHSLELTDEEIAHQLATLHGAVSEPLAHLVSNALLVMLTDNQVGDGLFSGSLSTRDALDEVLFKNPPLANFCFSYPRQPILLEDTWLPADQPVVISMAACNADPAVQAADVTGNRSHLAFGAGPHACPARNQGTDIAGDCVDQLLDALPDIRLSVPASELRWRPGPFHRALQELPVTIR